MNNPKILSDLRYQDNVIRINKHTSTETAATSWFREMFGTREPVYVRLLFEELGQKVYEAYTDPGSVDYLYIVVG